MAHRPPTVRRKALVLGGGFAGVQAAIELSKQDRFDVTLVSDRDFLYLFPISIWVPLRTITPERARVPLARIAQRHGFSTLISPVRAVDTDNEVVTCADRRLDYDYLVVALGAGKTTLPGSEHTLSLCAAPDTALDLRARIDDLIARGSGRIAFGFSGNPKDGSAVRGGPVFEFMFNVDHLLRKKGLRDTFELTFFAPMPHPGDRMGKNAVPHLTKMAADRDIAMRVGTALRGFDADGVVFADGSRLDADLVIFVPGASGHPVLESSGLPVNDAGFVRIDDHGLVEGSDNVYAVGDSAALEGPAWRSKQGHVAEIMARAAAHNITMADRGDPQRIGYQQHLSIICVMDIGSGAAFVYRDHRRELLIPLPIIGHWMKKGWGWYARATKTTRMPRLPGL
jgi:sulfide:quinone oxidoreductase